MFRNLSIRTRLLAGFGMVLLLLIGLATISIGRVNGVNENLKAMNEVNSVKQRYAINFRGSVHDRAISLRDVVLLSAPSEVEASVREIEELAAGYEASAGPLDAMLEQATNPSAEELQILASIKETEQKTQPIVEQVIALKRGGDQQSANRLLMERARPLFIEWLARINQFIDLQEANNNTVADSTREATGGFQLLIILLCGGALILGAVVAWWSINSVRPLRAMAGIMQRLDEEGDTPIPCTGAQNELGQLADAMVSFRGKLRAAQAASAAAERSKQEQTEMLISSIGEGLVSLSKGDLTARVTSDLTGPFAKLKDDFNTAMISLRDLIGAVTDSAQALRTGSHEIAQASEDLARRTESNAASLEETSAALTQIGGRTNATAEAAGRTVVCADHAISTVGEGRAIAVDAVAAMSRVRECAKGIDEVIEGVDKIAFQTRVLAMNAAVEAGRAGDAGRGFAVVADLVSALAMRAEEEAKRAREQLTVTQDEIVGAVDKVQKVDGALEDISQGIGEVHQLLGTMAADNQAQASAITQISSAVSQMDQSTQQNAAMVEETSAAARNLNSEVEALTGKASQFQVDERAVRSSPKKVEKPVVRASSYVSPVKALGAATGPITNGNNALQAQMSDWQDF